MSNEILKFTIDVDVIVSSEEMEGPPFFMAAHYLSHLLTAVSGLRWSIHLNFRNALNFETSKDNPCITLISLLGHLNHQDVNFADNAAILRQQISEVMETSAAPIFLCTIFRSVPQQSYKNYGWMKERIRRLNLLIAELSQEAGVNVIDLDRYFAHFGARLLRTDFRLQGPIAPHVAGDVIVSVLLAAALEDHIAEEVLNEAREMHKGLPGISERLLKFLMQRSTSLM